MTKVITVLLVLIFTSCEDSSIVKPRTGHAKCIINDSEYIFDCSFTIVNNKINMFMDNINSEGFLRKRIKFTGDCGLNLIGNQDSTTQMYFVTKLSDGDLAGNFYNVIDSDGFPDFVLIDQCSKDSISGKLQGSFYRDPPNSFKRDPSFPDTLIIRDGFFKGFIF